LNFSNGWKAVIRQSRLNDTNAQVRTFAIRISLGNRPMMADPALITKAMRVNIGGENFLQHDLAVQSRESVMEPITAAILAALPALATDTVKSTVKDAYDGLKAVIRRKWGDAGPITKAINSLEEDPNSKVQSAVLEEKILAAKAAEDAEVIQALHQLVEQLKTHGIGGESVARIRFNMSGGVVQGIVGAENVQIGSMTFGAPPKG
jgi:hypothetical protein